MNPIAEAAKASIAVGDFVIILALACAVVLIVFNIIDTTSSYTSPKPKQIMAFGWLSFTAVFGGLILATTAGVDYQQVGLAFGMTIGLKSILLLVVLLLLSFGTSWRLRRENLGR
ncbi:MAG: hypothetical protein ACK2T3_15925 [Candidatus Promineifilaceae bacterium]|jgi:hypothetical protein